MSTAKTNHDGEGRDDRIFRLLVEQAREHAIFFVNVDGRVATWNEGARRLKGYQPDEIIGQHVSCFFSPEDIASERPERALRAAVDEGSIEHEGWLVRKDGSRFWASVVVNAIRDTAGRLCGFGAVTRDLTARRRVEAELRSGREVLEHLPTGVVVHAPDASILFANRSARELLGLNVDPALGKISLGPAWSLVRDDEGTMPIAEYPVQRVLATRQALTGLTTSVGRRGTGDRVWLLVNALPDLDGEELRQVTVTLVDITDRKLAEEERRSLQARLARSDRLASMSNLAAGAAHAINNPLAYVLFNLESLADDLPRLARKLASARRELVERPGEPERPGAQVGQLDAGVWTDVEDRFKDALEGIRRIKDVARALGSLSQVKDDKIAPLDLRHAIELAVSVAPDQMKHRARVVMDLRTTAPVVASEERLSQVFLTLLINAAHATGDGDVEHNQISIRTRQEGLTVVAEVQGTGRIGPAGTLEQIFEPFLLTGPAGVVSGLGLSIAREIVAAYGGAIEVTSPMGRGVLFVIRLPAATE